MGKWFSNGDGSRDVLNVLSHRDVISKMRLHFERMYGLHPLQKAHAHCHCKNTQYTNGYVFHGVYISCVQSVWNGTIKQISNITMAIYYYFKCWIENVIKS